MAKFRKAIGAFLGGLTAAAVITIAGLFGLNLEPELAASIAMIVATFATWLAQPNAVLLTPVRGQPSFPPEGSPDGH